MIGYLLPQRAATVQTLGHPAAGVIGWVDASTNNTGVAVNPATALTYAAVWCATRVISETIATLPCILYRRTSDDSRERAREDDRYRLMTVQPHPYISAVSFFETMTAAMVLQGNCYAVIRRDGGVASQLEMRRPDSMRIEVLDDVPFYHCSEPQQVLNPEEMLHVPGLGGDGLEGWSVVHYAQQSIGAGIAADQYAGGQWGNGATPAGVLTHPMRLDKSAREHLRREWEEVHKGSSNAGKIAVMHGGMEFKPITMPNRDAQFLESRAFSIREIARWFRLPPHMLADLQDSSVRANIEQQAIEFIVYSLKPWLTRWQQALNRKLLGEDERGDLYFEFLLESLLQGDSAAQAQAWSVGRQWGWYSVNDIRRMMNMPPVDGGDVYLQPSNMVPADSEMARGEKPEPPTAPIAPDEPGEEEETPEAARAALRDNWLSSVNAIVAASHELRQAMERGTSQASEILAEADMAMQATLQGFREVTRDIHQDIHAKRLEQIRGCDEHLVESAHVLLREHLRCALKVEKADVLKAAKCTVRGRNFCEWLDTHYKAYVAQLAERIKPAVEAYQLIRMTCYEPHTVHAEAYCLRHREQLLKAADGSRAKFLDRVQAVVDTWDSEINSIRMGD